MSSLYGFIYSRRSLEYLETIAVKLRKQIVNKINALANEPFPSGYKPLKGMSAHEEKVYRIRSGDYRVLYVVRTNSNRIVVLDIDNRKDVYK